MNTGLRAAFEAQYYKNRQATEKWFTEYVGKFLELQSWKPRINQDLGLMCEPAHPSFYRAFRHQSAQQQFEAEYQNEPFRAS